MNGIYLTSREKRLLFVLRFCKKIKPKFDVSHLVSTGLIRPNSSGELNSIGEALEDGTYSLTDSGTRWFIQTKEKFFVKKLPVVLSLIALVKSFWPEIKNMFKWIIETVGKSGI